MQRKKKETPKLAAAHARMASRRAMALDLRKSGATYREIAATMKGKPDVTECYNESAAYQDVMFELRRINEQNAEAAAEVRTLEIQRLDRMLVGLDPAVESGDPAAINTALRVSERRAKLLGLDAPGKIDAQLSGVDGSPLFGVIERVVIDSRKR